MCWGRKPGRDQREEKRQAVHGDTPLALSAWATSETPPRVWGRPRYAVWPVWAKGNTPTGVGKTAFRSASLRCMKKHPHGCGEDRLRTAANRSRMETPPRVWGRPYSKTGSQLAGKKHPHGCGEDKLSVVLRFGLPETPPRVWGRPYSKTGSQLAGKKHPHGCGEDGRRGVEGDGRVETPPRVWGRPLQSVSLLTTIGNTPTGVGKTIRGQRCQLRCQKHPHGCGEDALLRATDYMNTETPPRVWGRHQFVGHLGHLRGNTPTGVGKTIRTDGTRTDNRKHPHGCGEDGTDIARRGACVETPPRVWGRPPGACVTCVPYGNTPTGVGKTEGRGHGGINGQKHPHGCGEDSNWTMSTSGL